MLQETNADLKKEIEKRGILIRVLIVFNLAVGVVLLLKWTGFFVGSLFGAILFGIFLVGAGVIRDRDDSEYKLEW